MTMMMVSINIILLILSLSTLKVTCRTNVDNKQIHEGNTNPDDYGYDGYEYEDTTDTNEIDIIGNINEPPKESSHVNKASSLLFFDFMSLDVSVSPSASIPALISDMNDNAVNRSRELFGCRPNETKALARALFRDEMRNETEDVLDHVIRKLEDKASKNEISGVQAKIATLALKKDILTKQIKLETPKLREVNVSYMNTNISMDDINATADMEKMNQTVHDADALKKLKFREKVNLLRTVRQKDWEEKEAKIFTVKLGLDCEGLICAACKAIVTELAYVLWNHKSNQLAHQSDHLDRHSVLDQAFCRSRNITLKYSDIVADTCNTYFLNDTLGYGATLWNAMAGIHATNNPFQVPKSILGIQQNTCSAIGACEQKSFTLLQHPVGHPDLLWDTNCFVCQSFAAQLQESIAVLNRKYIVDTILSGIITASCNHLELSPEEDALCRSIYVGSMRMNDLLWKAKLLGEELLHKGISDKAFPDSLCQDLGYCAAILSGPNQKSDGNDEQSSEAVFE